MLEYYSAQHVRLCPPLLKIRPCLLLLFILIFAFSTSAVATVFRQPLKIYQNGQSTSTLYNHTVINLELDVVLDKKMAKKKY